MSVVALIENFQAGYLHRPDEPSGAGLALTHGAGGNANGPLLVAIGDAFAAQGWLVYRYNLPFRLARPSGPPRPTAADKDRAGVRAAVDALRKLGCTKTFAAGHSYGGRQTSIAASEDEFLASGLILMSYPLHPPGKPEQLRTTHFPRLRIRTLFVHGTKDPFGSVEEMQEGLKQIPTFVELMTVQGAGHDLGKNRAGLAAEIAARANGFFHTI